MRKALFGLLILTFPSTAFSQVPDSVYQKWLLTPEIKKGFDFALSAAKLTYEDFTLRADYVEIDSARLRAVNELMTRSLQLPFYSIGTATRLGPKQNVVENLLQVSEPYHRRLSHNQHIPYLDNKSLELKKNTKRFPSIKKFNNSKEIGNQYFRLLATVYPKATVYRKDTSIWEPISAKYTKKEIDFIQNQFPRVILEDTKEEKLTVDELDSVQKLEDKLTREFVPLVAPPKFYQALSDVFSEGFLDMVGLTINYLKQDSPQFAEIREAIIWEDEKNKTVIGGPGPNHYKGDYALIIDLGGDDTYELTRRPNFENQIIIDLGGHDKYFALEDYALACGYFGYSVLIDAAGDDLYQGKNFSLGTGFFGCGLLWDQGGNDTYIGDQFTQGAGGFGIGILKDDGGNDRYHAAHMAQGFGFVRGVGALLDANGSDNYFAGGKYKELIGLSGEIRYHSMAQGCALGLRPYLSGGMGFLFDYEGDDSYSVDMNGQGSSYWWGLGALVDFKGNDRYLAQQYAQGAGIHMSLGILVDSSGNDFYFSKGVAQGAGHDWGAGMLFDLYGNDTYVATDGSQAFGNVNGIGILADGTGDDGYYVKNPKNSQVYGNARREYGSIAIMLDCGGTDRYDGNGGENKIWKPTGTTWGVGVDGEFAAPDSAQVKK